MKEKRIKHDVERGIGLLNRMLNMFPFSIKCQEIFINTYRRYESLEIFRSLWFKSIFESLDQEGYLPDFNIYTPITNISQYYDNIQRITNKIIEFLNDIERKPKDDIYLMNRSFMILRYFFKILTLLINLGNNYGGWNEAIEKDNGEARTAFYQTFGFYFYPEMFGCILTIDEFTDLINKILVEFNLEEFSLSKDGILRYHGVTAQAEEFKRAYNLLTEKKFENVIKELDLIHRHIQNKHYSDALSSCRRGLEALYKRLLLNYKIKKLFDGEDTDKGTVSNLAQTVRNYINKLFKFPSYSKNLDTQGFFHLIESSKHVISGLANSGGSHGRSKPPKVRKDDVNVAQSYLILLINTLLPFLK